MLERAIFRMRSSNDLEPVVALSEGATSIFVASVLAMQDLIALIESTACSMAAGLRAMGISDISDGGAGGEDC